MTSVILVQHNNMHLTREAIRSFISFHPAGYEFIVVDNASTDGEPEDLRREFPGLQLIRNNENVGFGGANNQGATVAKGEILFFLNNDTVTTSEILSAITREFERDPQIGVIGPKLLDPDGSFQLSSGELPSFWREMLDKFLYNLVDRGSRSARNYAARVFGRERAVGWVTGAALFIRRDLYRKLGGFDEKMFMYFEDKDLCYRVAQAGYSVEYLPRVSILHMKAGSSGGEQKLTIEAYRKSQLYYYSTHRPWIECAMLQAYLKLSGKSPS